jgi:glycosyltransferase involved in cell wall biosynthesis
LKILYIASSFPAPDKGASIYTDLAEELRKFGHEIIVVVSEQPRNKKKSELTMERGFEVLRVVTGEYFDIGYIQKGITTLKIPFLMRMCIKKFLRERKFDFILFEAPPVTNACLIKWAKKFFDCPAYLMLKDIFPQNAVDLGIMKRNGILFRYFVAKEKKLYEISDHIGCMSQENMKYLLSNNPWLDPDKVELFPNTKKLSDDIISKDFQMRELYNISKEACVFLFGGNMGRPQYIDLLCKAVEMLKEEKDIFFLFIGRGTDRHKIEDTIRENDIKNALVIENIPRSHYEQIIKECDVGLIILDPRFTIPNFPSRILSYMEYAKPVLAATDHVTDIKSLIEDAKCGEWVWSGNTDGFVSKVKEMARSKNLVIQGINGRKYIENNFRVEKSVKILEKHFNS